MQIASNDHSATRPTLLERLRKWDDQESWKRFFDTYWRLIYSTSLKAGLSETEAEEVVQETVLSVAKTMPGFQYDPGVCSFKTWLLHLTRKRISDQFRKRRRSLPMNPHRPYESDDTATAERIPEPMPELERIWRDEWEKNLAEAALERAREQVSSRQFQIFDLYVTKGCSVLEVAKTFRVSVAQVYLAKHRVLTIVKRELRKLEQQSS